MKFVSSAQASIDEFKQRHTERPQQLSFGVKYLDDATKGIWSNDLVLLGASSGAGKTELCCGIAAANVVAGKKVFFAALEAEPFEIERRIKYQIIAHKFYNDIARPGVRLSYDDWLSGELLQPLERYEHGAQELFDKYFQGLYTHYKGDSFGVKELVQAVLYNAPLADLFIIDHVHYFDWDDTDNRAMKEIAKTARKLSLEVGKPIVLVAHLRKSDRSADRELAPGMEEFMGTSDLYKIATKVVTVGPGKPTFDGRYETFFRVCKNRRNGTSTRYLGRVSFDPRRNGYEDSYALGWAEQTWRTGFEHIDASLYPTWARGAAVVGADSNGSSAQSSAGSGFQNWRRALHGMRVLG